MTTTTNTNTISIPINKTINKTDVYQIPGTPKILFQFDKELNLALGKLSTEYGHVCFTDANGYILSPYALPTDLTFSETLNLNFDRTYSLNFHATHYFTYKNYVHELKFEPCFALGFSKKEYYYEPKE